MIRNCVNREVALLPLTCISTCEADYPEMELHAHYQVLQGTWQQEFQKDRNSGLKLLATGKALSANKKVPFCSICINLTKEQNKQADSYCKPMKASHGDVWLMMMKKLFSSDRVASIFFLK